MWARLPFMILILFSSCNRNMRFQASYRAWENPRLPPPHTVRQEGPQKGLSLDKRALIRGQKLFQTTCSACHGLSGEGGFVQKRGLTVPTLLSDEVRAKSLHHYVDVITRGFGTMPSYQRRLTTEERQSVAHYLKVLQLARKFPKEDLSSEDRRRLR